MTVQDKVEEAQRRLSRLEQSYTGNQTDFQDDVNVFLDSVNSIPDYLLEDYNRKYGLGITMGEKLYPSVFEQKAKASSNTTVIGFIKWFNAEKRRIESTTIGKTLANKRDLHIHRTIQRPNKIVVNINENVNNNTSSSSRDLYFQDLSGITVKDACEQFLNMMRKFVSDAQSNFP